MVPFMKGQDVSRYKFNHMPFWVRIYNIRLERRNQQVGINLGGAIGELLAIDWRDRDGCWIEYIRVRVKLDISKPLRQVIYIVGIDEDEIMCATKYERLPTFCYTCSCRGHHTKKCGQAKSIKGIDNPKFQYGIGEGQKGVDGRFESTAQEEGFVMIQREKEKVKIMDEVLDLCSPKSKHAHQIMNLERTRIKHKKNKVGNGEGFYSYTDPNQRHLSWGTLRRVETLMRGGLGLLGASFNEVIDDAKKCRGRRKAKVAMDNIRIIMDDLALVDVKPDKGWKLREEKMDPRLSFGFEACWAKGKEAKDQKSLGSV
ncbi:hypothetical protein GOBAR_AA30768 [Gossypium barbadense]|uniref:Zinc knuckle CX2CX4HX4C domain-containing protein n=1 Tax=Gossypium barbadense TaxID=3634 RepID=A0A2P5WFQ6_GOSBA|nr:hypothetical protein GOBAR_AA30768 [Gossypium barbadense]